MQLIKIKPYYQIDVMNFIAHQLYCKGTVQTAEPHMCFHVFRREQCQSIRKYINEN